jgi:hypothetical protein
VYKPVTPGSNRLPGENPGVHRICTNRKIGKDENGENFCVQTPILANLGFMKS